MVEGRWPRRSNAGGQRRRVLCCFSLCPAGLCLFFLGPRSPGLHGAQCGNMALHGAVRGDSAISLPVQTNGRVRPRTAPGYSSLAGYPLRRVCLVPGPFPFPELGYGAGLPGRQPGRPGKLRGPLPSLLVHLDAPDDSVGLRGCCFGSWMPPEAWRTGAARLAGGRQLGHCRLGRPVRAACYGGRRWG